MSSKHILIRITENSSNLYLKCRRHATYIKTLFKKCITRLTKTGKLYYKYNPNFIDWEFMSLLTWEVIPRDKGLKV